MKLNKDEWCIAPGGEHGWFVSNHTYWGKTYKDEYTGKEYCSGWDAYYLHKDGTVQTISDYYKTKELAQEALDKYLRRTDEITTVIF